MPIPQIPPGKSTTGTIFEKDAQGNPVSVIPANIVVDTTDHNTATAKNNGDGTVTVTAGTFQLGTCQLTVHDNVFGIQESEPIVVADPPTVIGTTGWSTPS